MAQSGRARTCRLMSGFGGEADTVQAAA